MQIPVMSLGERFKVTEGRAVSLSGIDAKGPDDLPFRKEEGKALVQGGLETLRGLQERLHAEGRWSLLVILQGMDASGKDGVVEHVMSGINPQGCRIVSFSAPTLQELRHDFLWRAAVALPERGQIGIFVRSHYEDVLIARVHQDILDKQMLPKACITERIWTERFESIRAFERHLVRNGTVVLKFFLHISKAEQKARLLARIDQAEKNWKFDPFDLVERRHWADFTRAYEDAISTTSTDDAPWYVIPADRKWLARLAVSQTIIATLQNLDPQFPTVNDTTLSSLKHARAQLIEDA